MNFTASNIERKFIADAPEILRAIPNKPYLAGVFTQYEVTNVSSKVISANSDESAPVLGKELLRVAIKVCSTFLKVILEC